MFAAADLVVLTKVDLLPHVDFDVQRARSAVARLNPKAEWLEVSAKTGAGPGVDAHNVLAPCRHP